LPICVLSDSTAHSSVDYLSSCWVTLWIISPADLNRNLCQSVVVNDTFVVVNFQVSTTLYMLYLRASLYHFSHCKVSGVVDRGNRGFVGVLADADSIPTSTPTTASASLARSSSPRSRAHTPFIRLCPRPHATAPSTPTRLVLDSATRQPRRPLTLKGPRLSLAATFVISRRHAGPPPLVPFLRVSVSCLGVVFSFDRSHNMLLLNPFTSLIPL